MGKFKDMPIRFKLNSLNKCIGVQIYLIVSASLNYCWKGQNWYCLYFEISVNLL